MGIKKKLYQTLYEPKEVSIDTGIVKIIITFYPAIEIMNLLMIIEGGLLGWLLGNAIYS